MTARKCDRCSRYYDYYEGISSEGVQINTVCVAKRDLRGETHYSKESDLCPDCMRSLRSWWKNGKESN